ncbi:hypothetical protein [Synechocystis sp. LKSZ1]|uniref:hypothetical protein n=1 Tax=Synechocystis sp. LKSZ1 TaxID=3144951 RepID=UPI00336BD26B
MNSLLENTDVYLGRQKIQLKPQDRLGQGGEAEVYRLSSTLALKLFKQPSHPDYQGDLALQTAVEQRLALYQEKLKQFPQGLPERVVVPQSLVHDRQGQVIRGYTMPLVANADLLFRYGDRRFRQGIRSQVVVAIFQDLHQTLHQLHQHQVVIGDFNDLNVLVKDQQAYLIDADSFQFGRFPCCLFTPRFLDPLCWDTQGQLGVLGKAYSPDSDWYAFTIMLMQCLLFVDPYGGIHAPSAPRRRLSPIARIQQRLTVFHPEVRYPKPALPPQTLTDELLHHFHQVFEQDRRGPFPKTLLDHLLWQTCSSCGQDYARSTCPHCGQGQLTPTPVGSLSATLVFQTQGQILAASYSQGKLGWLEWQEEQFTREDGTPVLAGPLLPQMHCSLQGPKTWIAQGEKVLCLEQGQVSQCLSVSPYRGKPQFAVNDQHTYWLEQGLLWQDGRWGPVVRGELLDGQTQVWIGPSFGFGCYRVGHLQRAFVFEASTGRLNDQIPLSPSLGQILQTACVLSPRLCWLFITTQIHGRRHYTCQVITAQGQSIAQADCAEGESHWLTQLAPALVMDNLPFAAVGEVLLAPTDEGIIRIEHQGQQLVQTKTFTETEPWVNGHCSLIPGPQGLWVVHPQQILWLQLS